MDIQKIKNEIRETELKLERYRATWVKSSPTYKKLIEQAAKIQKTKLRRLQNRLDPNRGPQIKLEY